MSLLIPKSITTTGLSELSVSGFKSIDKEQSLRISPLTILSGTNNSGKSSMIQPLLLLKQTLEAQYDAGPLLLDGKNVAFTTSDQILSRRIVKQQDSKRSKVKKTDKFIVKLTTDGGAHIKLSFVEKTNYGFELISMEYFDITKKDIIVLENGMSDNIIKKQLLNLGDDLIQNIASSFERSGEKIKYETFRNRCFLNLRLNLGKGRSFDFSITDAFENLISNIIHVPSLRGSQTERTYKTTFVGEVFPGIFNDYIASIINVWQKRKDKNLNRISKQLDTLFSIRNISAEYVDDTQVKLHVTRTQNPNIGSQRDMVNIADTGFGISQVLPVLTALLTAKAGQIVYVEEPEIHLHPKAQYRLGQYFIDAANRGVKVILETHSTVLLRSIQTLVANNEINSESISLNWFTRDKNTGQTIITSAQLDKFGSYGDWPIDFDETYLEVEDNYLTAVEKKESKE